MVLTGQDLGGLTLVAGVYCFSSSAQLTGTVTLDAQGDPDAVFIFQIGSTLTTASGSNVNLVNGAQACNVVWQVGSSATLGTATTFRGNILALQSITLNTDATVEGRALARNGAVTMDSNTVTRTTCAQPPPPPPPPPPTDAPTDEPTDAPTDAPTDEPTDAPTDSPTDGPTDAPTDAPTDGPTETPTETPTPGDGLPDDGPDAGGGGTAGLEHTGLLVAGAALLTSGGVALAARRRLGRHGPSR